MDKIRVRKFRHWGDRLAAPSNSPRPAHPCHQCVVPMSVHPFVSAGRVIAHSQVERLQHVDESR
eukprot:scaffold197426_cov34-Tisochrysis_lutea.AAC.2